MLNKKNFKKYSLFTLVFTVLTILWGAWVRISVSGNGCGNDWPLCKQSFLPDDIFSLIEWIHRLTSGLSLLFILVLFVITFKIYPKNHFLRKLASLSFLLIIIEALIGALLVLGNLVGLNESYFRVFVLAFHLINSLILVASLTLCWKTSLWNKFKIKKPQFYFLLIFPILALTGNIASLAGVLFPTESLSQSLTLDFLPTAHITLKLRPLHPLFAILFLIVLGVFTSSIKKLRHIFFFTLFTVLFGFATLISLSPVWMKLSHLLIAYTLWISLVSISFTNSSNTPNS